MILQTTSKTPKLWKLLRTLAEYQAESLLIPVGQAVRIWHKGEWQSIQDHPILTSEELHTHLRGSFGENVSTRLDHGLPAWVDTPGHTFFLKFYKNSGDGLLKIDRLNALPELREWPAATLNWLRVGGLLKVESESLYSAILKYLAQNQSGLVISFEKELRFPLHSALALVHQKECPERSLKSLLAEAAELHPFVLGIGNLELNKEDEYELKEAAKQIPCVYFKKNVVGVQTPVLNL